MFLMGVYLIGTYLTGVYFIGVCLTRVYLMSMHLIGMHSISVYIMGVHLEGVNVVRMYHRNFSYHTAFNWGVGWIPKGRVRSNEKTDSRLADGVHEHCRQKQQERE